MYGPTTNATCDKRYVLRYDPHEDEWTLQSDFDGPELFARPGIEVVTVGAAQIREAESRIEGCAHCHPDEGVSGGMNGQAHFDPIGPQYQTALSRCRDVSTSVCAGSRSGPDRPQHWQPDRPAAQRSQSQRSRAASSSGPMFILGLNSAGSSFQIGPMSSYPALVASPFRA